MKTYFQQKKIVLTGGTSGIGYHLVKLLANSDNHILIVSRNEKKLLEVQREFSPDQCQVAYYVCDLANPEAVDKLIRKLDEGYANLDVLINNAGFGISGSYHKHSWQQIETLCQVNMLALARFTHWASGVMATRGRGHILNISAVAAFQPQPYFGVFGASRSFVTNLTVALYEELKSYGIIVSCAHPGATKTNFEETAQINQTRAVKMLGLMDPEKVARKILSGLVRKRTFIIAGFPYKMIYYSSLVTPMNLGLKIMKFLFKK